MKILFKFKNYNWWV